MDKSKYNQIVLIEDQSTNSEVTYICCGKNCKRKGTSFLKIKYINLHGWFCDSCSEDLKISDLIVSKPSIFENRLKIHSRNKEEVVK